MEEVDDRFGQPTADLRLDGAALVASIGALVILPSRSRTKSRP
jgi:hypothetical protein